MKKQLLIILSLLAAVLSGCSTNEELSRSDFKALSFETFVGKGTTRAVPKTAFTDGDHFGVIAYTHGTTPWAGATDKKLFMENVKVTRQGGLWTYAPLQYWEEGTRHTFLAYSPHNPNYLLGSDGLLWNVSTPETAASQADLLYSIPESGSKDLEWEEGRTVTLTFRHALSQIQVSAATNQDYSGYYTATITRVRLVGIANSGKLNLNAPDAATSPWSDQGVAGGTGTVDPDYNPDTDPAPETYVYAATTAPGLNVELSTADTPLNPGNDLFMQIPQDIRNDGSMYIELTYNIAAQPAGNVSNDKTGQVTQIKLPAITWEHNHIYRYKIQMDLQQLLSLKPIEMGDPSVTLWEDGSETKLPEDLTVTIQPTTDGDTEQVGTGNAQLGVTKAYGAGTQTFSIENPEKDDQWIVEVGPELTDPTTPASRAEKKDPPAAWLTVQDVTHSGNPASKIFGTTDASIRIQTEANSSSRLRRAEVTVRRALSGVTHILVTQEGAPAAIIEANSTQFPVEGGTNKLTITAAEDDVWTLSTDQTWLTLKNEAGEPVTGGTGSLLVNATATANFDLTTARTATITLGRGEDKDPLLVEVTQSAAQPMTVSATNFQFAYSSGSRQTLAITNPEAERGTDFNWSLSGTDALSSWLSITPTAGTSGKDVLTLTTTALNMSTTARPSATFTIKRRGQADIPVTVTQAGAPAATLSASSIAADYAEQTRTFSVSSPAGIPWTLTADADWLTLTPASGNGNATVSAHLNQNPSETDTRTATITLMRDGQATPVKLTLVQGVAPVTKTSVNPKVIEVVPETATTKATAYLFRVTVPKGVKWYAKMVQVSGPMDKNMTFYGASGDMKTSKTYTGTGEPQNLIVKLGIIPSAYINIALNGFFMIYPDNEDPVSAVLYFHK